MRPPALIVPVCGDRAAAPSILASIRQVRAVTGQVAARESRDTVTVVAYCNDTSFSITHGDAIVSPIASANVTASPTAEITATTSPINGMASTTLEAASSARMAAAIWVQIRLPKVWKMALGMIDPKLTRVFQMLAALPPLLAMSS